MSLHPFKLRLRRIWRRRSAQVEDLGQEATDQLEVNFLRRLPRLKLVWRFTTGWLLLFTLIIISSVFQIISLRNYYQTEQPIAGGIYSIGMQGSFTTANPLYAVNDIDTSVSKLLFASLLTYDNHNNLVGDLADRWSIDDSGTVYRVHLRPNLTWQDGQPLSSADVVFTYQTIQDPDAQSPLLSSWQGVKVVALDSRTISFTLPNPLSSFPYGLTNGIIPKHILQSVSPTALRSISFNTTGPIGSGPFRWGTIGVSNTSQTNTEEQISLLPFQNYWASRPKLNNLNLYAFTNLSDMIEAYNSRQITSIAGLTSMPANITGGSSNIIYNLPQTAAVFVFFKTTNPVLQDPKIRQALVEAANRSAITEGLGNLIIPVDEPLLKGQLGYDPAYAQVTNQAIQASALLDSDGWLIGSNGFRYKNGQELSFVLSLPSSGQYKQVANLLVSQWKAVGIAAQIQLEQSADFQATLSSHAYDAVLYGISIGVDPDIYVYWDSSQGTANALERLNFSEYNSSQADAALEAGRTRSDNHLRIIKYQQFLADWLQDEPALALYQPRFLVISHDPVYGLSEHQINSVADQFNNAQAWMIHTGWVTSKSQ